MISKGQTPQILFIYGAMIVPPMMAPPSNLKGLTPQKHVSIWEFRAADDRVLGAQMMSEPKGEGQSGLGGSR